MKFVIPRYVDVHGKRFTVALIDTYDYMGMMDYEAARIWLTTNQSRPQMVLTFWHEYFHALHYRLGLHQALSREMLEILAEAQSQAIVEIFKLK